MTSLTTRLSRVLAAVALGAVFVACGGSGDSGTTPPPPPDNTPNRVTLSVTGPLTLASGGTTTVTASVLTRDGRTLTGQTITWTSSDANVARVTDGTITAVLVGTANITAAVGAVTSAPLAITTTPGTPTQLTIRTQPGGARVAIPLQTQPVVDIKDAAGNLISAGTLAITAAIASGGGTLAGTATVSAVGGVATFAGLTLSGTTGARTLIFTAAGVTPATSTSFTLAPGDPAVAALVQQPIGGAAGAVLLQAPIVELRDVSGNVATGATTPVAATLAGGAGLVSAGGSVTPVNGRATFSQLVITGTPGLFQLAFATTGVPAVTSAPFVLVPILYGTTSQKIVVVNQGTTFTPAVSAPSAPTYRSSATSRASVDAQGRITAVAEGQTWISATVPAGGDSILVIVPRSLTGPVVGAALPGFTLTGGSTDFELVILPRGTPVGSFTVLVTINTQDYNATFNPFTLTIPGAQVQAVQLEGGPMRFSVIATTPITQPTSFGRVALLNGPPGAKLTISVSALDANAPDGTDLFPIITSAFFPVIFR